MSMFDDAAKCFNENLRLFANPQSEPEKYNLYAGLANLASGLDQLEGDIDQLLNEVRQVSATVGR